MISVKFHTNLDNVMYYENFPEELPARPVVGDLIESRKIHKTNQGDRVLQLEVVRCTWKPVANTVETYILECELHLPKSRWENITSFEKWYRQVRSGTIF